MSSQFIKDPSAVLDYSIDWTEWLSDDTIVTSTWSITAGIEKVRESATAKVSTIWLGGGEVGSRYTVTNSITTASGRTDQRSIAVTVWER